MLESKVEKHLVEGAANRGGMCIKLDASVYAGIPDRLLVLPGVQPRFVEVKRPKGGRVSARQDAWRVRLNTMSQDYSLLSTIEEVDAMFAAYDRGE